MSSDVKHEPERSAVELLERARAEIAKILTDPRETPARKAKARSARLAVDDAEAIMRSLADT